jgi:prenylcysteine oxidase/farnesylcysteine lyase
MASGGAKAIKGGNFQIFENFVRESKASIHLSTRVTGLESKSTGKWLLSASKQTNGEQSAMVEEYDSVILAAPFDTLGISLPSNLEPVIPSPYVHLHVTLLTTTAVSANPVYFNQASGSAVPDLILTTAQGIRAGGPTPEFNSMGYGRRIADGSDERVVKIFSEKKIEDEWLSNMFGNVGWVHRKVVG